MNQTLALGIVLSLQDRISPQLGAIINKTRQLVKADDALQERMDKLNKTQRAISSLKSDEAVLGQRVKKITEAREKVAALQDKFDSMEKPTQRAAAAIERAQLAANKLSMREGELRMKAQETRQALEREGIATDDLVGSESRLAQQVEKVNGLLNKRTELAKRTEKIKSLGGALARGGTAATVAGIGMRSGVAPLLGAFSEQEDAATQLKVSMMGADGAVSDQFAKINALAERLGNKLPGTTAQLQDMMSTLIQQGAPAKDVLDYLGEATANLGVVLKMDYKDAAEFSQKVKDATGTASKDMMGLMDVIQRTHYLGMNTDDMLQGFSKISPVMDVLHQKGLDMAKTVAPLLVAMNQGALKGESGGNALRKVFDAGLDSEKVGKANKVLKGTGVNLNFVDKKGNSAGLDNLLAQLEKLKKLNDTQRVAAIKELWGDDAETNQALQILMDKGKDGYTATLERMKAQADIQQRVNAVLGTLTNLWDAATGTFKNLAVAFTEPVSGDIKVLIEWLQRLQATTGQWMTDHPVIVRYLALFAFGVTALVSVLGPLAIGLSLVARVTAFFMSPVGGLIKLLPSLGSAIMHVASVLRALMMATPVLMIIAAAGLLIFKYWKPIAAFFSGLWAGIKAGLGPLSPAFQRFSDTVSESFASVVKFLQPLWEWLSKITGQVDDTGGAAKAMGEKWGEGIADMIKWVGNLTSVFEALPGKLFDFGANMIDGLVNGLLSKADKARQTIVGIASSLPESVRGVLGIHSPSVVFAQIGAHMIGGVIQGVNGRAPEAMGAIKNVSERLPNAWSAKAALAGLMLPMAVAAQDISAQMPKVPPMAVAAQDMSAQMPKVPPMAVAAQDMSAQMPKVQPTASISAPGASAKTQSPGGQQGQPIIHETVTFNIYPTPGMDENALAKMVAAELRKHQRETASNARASLFDRD